jgi:hypothetical protein
MKVAVLFTGCLRTIEMTCIHLKTNLVANSKHSVKFFATLQNDSNRDCAFWESWLHRNLSTSVECTWFDPKDVEWTSLRESLLQRMQVEEGWKTYLRSSGSMIEYYQMWKSYQKMVEEEKRLGYRYDYVIRCRPDTIFGQVIDFEWLAWTKDDIQARLDALSSHGT